MPTADDRHASQCMQLPEVYTGFIVQQGVLAYEAE